MSAHIVSLTWDGHHHILVRVFQKLLQSNRFVYCTITAEGQKLKAHKEVLCAFSPYFELLLREETENNPTIILSGVNFRDLKSLVDFIYKGKLEITEDRIEDLLEVAECLQIKGLGDAHMDDGSGKINNISISRKRLAHSFGMPHKRIRPNYEDTVKALSKKADAKHIHCSSKSLHGNSIKLTMPRQTSFETLKIKFDVQNVPSKSNLPLIPAQSTLSSIKTSSLLLHGGSVVKTEPGPDVVENMIEPMREMSISESSGPSYENTEDTILGLSADTNSTNDNNHTADLPQDSISPGSLNSQLHDRGVSTVQNELGNVNLPSQSVHPTVPAVDKKDSFFHSVKTEPIAEDEMFLSEWGELTSEIDEYSERILRNAGLRFASMADLQTEQGDKRRSGCTGSCSAEDGTLRLHSLGGVFVVADGEGGGEPELQVIPGIFVGDVNPQDMAGFPFTPPSRERDLPGPSGMGGRVRSNRPENRSCCQPCDKTLPCCSSSKVHMRSHASGRPHRRDARNYSEGMYAERKEHQRAQSGSNAYKATAGDYASSRSSSKMKQQSRHSGSKPYMSSRDKSNPSHPSPHSRESPFKFPASDYLSANGSHLKKYLIAHGGWKTLKCSDCNCGPGETSNLRKHQLDHPKETPPKNTQRDYASANSSTAKMHSGLKTYKCPECDFVTTSRTSSKQHRHAHSDMKYYRCQKCEYKTVHRHSFVEHQKIHSSYNPLRFNECSYEALDSRIFTRYLQSHSDSRRTFPSYSGQKQ